MVILKKIEKPQDIFVLGDLSIEGVKDAFLIDDDECGFTLRSGEKRLGIGSFGSCIVLTKEELVSHRDKINMDNYEDIFGNNSILIENFIGDIALKVIVNGDDIINDDNFNLYDFIQHQDFSYYVEDIIVDFGEGCTFKQFEMSNTILDAICREESIDSVFRD
jgi:hypothetical protein